MHATFAVILSHCRYSFCCKSYVLYIKQDSVLILTATLLSTKNAQYSQQTDIHAPKGFEPTIPGSDRPSEVKACYNHADIRLTTRRTDCSNWFHETHSSSFACVGTDRPPSCGLILCLLLYTHTHTSPIVIFEPVAFCLHLRWANTAQLLHETDKGTSSRYFTPACT